MNFFLKYSNSNNLDYFHCVAACRLSNYSQFSRIIQCECLLKLVVTRNSAGNGLYII